MALWSVRVRCFFFKQKTAYEMRISDWSSDGALPISLFNLSCVAGRRSPALLWCKIPSPKALVVFGWFIAVKLSCRPARRSGARKSVVEGKSVSVRVDRGGRRIITTKTQQHQEHLIEVHKRHGTNSHDREITSI